VNFRTVLHVVSHLLFFLMGVQVLTLLASLALRDPAMVWIALLKSAAISGLAGAVLFFPTRGHGDLTRKDGFAVVTVGWMCVALFGSLPYIFSETTASIPQAIFESFSGFTTTGASVIPVLEVVPRGILLWRSLTNWFGGLGVLVLCIAILPFLKAGAVQLYQAEVTGPTKERLTPHIVTTAKWLWMLYVTLTVLCAILLAAGGMGFFDSLCHALTACATGGFSTRTASVAAFDSLYIEVVLVVFMLIGAINFSLHFHGLRGRPGNYFKDSEFKIFVVALTFAVVVVALDLWRAHGMDAGTAWRHALFNCTSVVTTTGFGTGDFDTWPAFAKLIILALMLTGACAGSTSGGIKFVRVVLMIKICMRELKLFVRPHAVYKVKLNGRSVDDHAISNVAAFVMIFVLVFGMGAGVMTFFTPDLETAVGSVAATLGNIGPGFGSVGPTGNYAGIPDAGLMVLSGLMLLGRLELFTLLVILSPAYWKK